MAPVRLVVFDLDETLIDARKAWEYTVEQSLLSVCGRQVSASGLVGEYRRRPWRHVFSVLAPGPVEVERCEETAIAMYHRSALKRLLVHEGVGMALDGLRAQRLEIGAISREPHARALKQIESTGLERFLSVLSPTAEGEPWNAGARVRDCASYLRRAPQEAVVISGEADTLRLAEKLGFRALLARWATATDTSELAIQAPRDLESALRGLARG